MSLYKNLISVPVTGGIDTKTTSKLLESGFFRSLRNTVRRKKGAIEKRYGFSALGNYDTDGNEIVSGQRLDAFFDDLVLIDNTNLYSYLSATGTWKNRGSLVPALVSSSPVISSTGKSVMADCDYRDGLECYAWEDSRGGVYCSVINRETGAAVIADTAVSSTGTRPKVVALQSTFMITYIESGALKVRRITAGEPDTLQTAQTVESGATDFPYDLVGYGNYAIFAYNTATAIRVGYILPTGAVGSIVSASADPYEIALLGQNAINITPDPMRGLIYVFFHDSAGASSDDLRCQILDVNLQAVDDVDIEASIAGVRNITGAVIDQSGIVTVYYEVSAASVKNHTVRQNTVTWVDGTTYIDTPSVFKRSVGLSTKAFLVDGVIYVGLVHQSALQSTYFVAQSSGDIIARMQPSTASGLTASSATPGVLRSGLCRVVSVDNDRILALSVVNRLTTVDTTTSSGFVGVNRQTLSFNSSQFDTAILGQNLHIAGGMVQDYDGVRTIEHGFHLYPEDVTASASNAAGTLTSSSTYRLKVLYEWVDGKGQIHRSAPSVAVSQVMGVGDDTITVVVPSLRLTSKTAVKIVVYRTKSNEISVYYRDNEAANDATADTVSITLTNPDTTIATKEILYTVGGTLDNIAPPAARVAHAHKKRLFLAGTEDGDIWYSREQVKGEGVSFSDGLKFTLADVTATETLDDKIVFFQERAIYTLPGDGPNDAGTQNDYGPPQLIPGDVGCTNQKSLVSTPVGLIFQSAKGIYLLDRGLNTVYIGDRVEDFNHLTISSAVLLKDNNEVRFTTTDGVCLVYNYYFNEWSTFSNYEAVSAVNVLDTYCHLKSTGVVNQEIEGQFNDNGVVYSMYIETNWFQFAKLQGFQRIYYWALIGDFVSHHTTRVKLAYDFEEYYSDPVYFDTEAGLGTETYGTGVYGSESPYGGSGSSVYQFRSKPYRQKCQSVKLVIEDLDTATDAGGGSFKLVAIAFQVGSKTGLAKMGESKTRGT